MEPEGGIFSIGRVIFGSDIWTASPWKLKIFLYLIGQANHKDQRWGGVIIKRGETAKSRSTVRKAVGYKVGYRYKYPSEATVRRIYEALTKEGRINERTTNGIRITTILNYDEYQLSPHYERRAERRDSDEVVTKSRRYNNNENNENKTINHFPTENDLSGSEDPDLYPGQSDDPPLPGKKKTPACPHEKIIAAYHDILPELNRIQVWDDTAQGYLRSRWREDIRRQTVDWWADFFKNAIRTSDFLMGNKNGFRADLRWIVRPTNFAKIMNGNYVNRGANTGSRLTDTNIATGQRWLKKMQKGEI